jgi:hypothetical protein
MQAECSAATKLARAHDAMHACKSLVILLLLLLLLH